MRVLDTAKDVFAVLGGIQAVADLTGAKYKAVQNWHSFGRFPPRTFLAIEIALEKRGFAAPMCLWGMVKPKAVS